MIETIATFLAAGLIVAIIMGTVCVLWLMERQLTADVSADSRRLYAEINACTLGDNEEETLHVIAGSELREFPRGAEYERLERESGWELDKLYRE